MLLAIDRRGDRAFMQVSMLHPPAPIVIRYAPLHLTFYDLRICTDSRGNVTQSNNKRNNPTNGHPPGHLLKTAVSQFHVFANAQPLHLPPPSPPSHTPTKWTFSNRQSSVLRQPQHREEWKTAVGALQLVISQPESILPSLSHLGEKVGAEIPSILASFSHLGQSR